MRTRQWQMQLTQWFQQEWSDVCDLQESEWVVVSPRRWGFGVRVAARRFLQIVAVWFDVSGFVGGARFMAAAIRLGRSARLWWGDLVPEYWEGEREGTGDGDNGEVFMAFFILSEALLFRAFFWAFVARAANPVVETRCSFPPKGIYGPELFWLPLTNSAVLLRSGVAATVALERRLGMGPVRGRAKAMEWLRRSVRLAALFVWAQWSEYRCLWVGAPQSTYGSAFFLATGFHGFHVIVGGLFLAYWAIRLAGEVYRGRTWGVRQTGLKMRVWYWHFVDVVWLVLFRVFYYWASVS